MTNLQPQVSSLPRRSADRLALAALCLLAFAWRLVGLTSQSLWRDEVDALRFALRPLPELLRMFTKPGENGPLFFAALRPWLAAAGTSEFALRFQAVVAGTIAVPLVYVLARRLLQTTGDGSRQPDGLSLRNVPLVAALLIAVNPYLMWYSQEGKMYGLLVVLALAASLAFLAALEGGKAWRWLLYLGLLTASILTHTLAVLLVPVHVAWFLILWPRYRKRWLALTVTLLLPILPFIALVGWWQIRLFTMPDFQTGHPFVRADQMAAALLTGFSRGVASGVHPLGLAVVVFLLLAGLALAGRAAGQSMRSTNGRLSAILLAWLILPPALLYLVTLNKPLFTERYLIWISPALLMALAMGISVVFLTWRPLGWLGLGFLVLWAGIGPGWRQTHTVIKADFRSAAAYVESRQRSGDRLMFLIPYNRYTFEYYAGGVQDPLDGLYTNNGNPVEQVAQEMEQRMAEVPAVWLVSSEEEMWDQRGLVQAWLEENARRSDQQTFNRIEVIRYELKR